MDNITQNLRHHGIMFVLSSPSGAGKTTIIKQLLYHDTNLKLSISATTRVPRPGEINGQDYYFLEQNVFQHYINEKKFLEHARVFDNFYGTLKEPILKDLQNCYDVIFDVDWQGAQTLTQQYSTNIVKIFILPPSLQELERRLQNRNQDAHEIVARRMLKATDEVSHWHEYDYVIVNNDIDKCVKDVYAILIAERYKKEKQQGLAAFVQTIIPKP